MRRTLFLIVLWITGNSASGQNFRADSLLEKIAADPSRQSVYLQGLLKDEYASFREAEMQAHLTKVVAVLDEKQPDVLLRIHGFRMLGAFLWKEKRYAESLNLYDKSVFTAVSDGHPTEAGNSYIQVAHRFIENEMYPQALERVYRANEYFNRAEDKLRSASAHALAASIGFHAENFLISVEEVEKALALYKAIDPLQFTRQDSTDIMSTYNTCGLAYTGLRNEERAMACYAEAEKFATLLHDKFWVGLINGNKAMIYSARGELDMAISSLEIDLNNSIAFREWGSALGSYVQLTGLFIRKQEWTKAEQTQAKADALIRQYGATRNQQSQNFKNLSRILEHEGDVVRAYRALQRHEQLSDSLEVEKQSSGLMRIKNAHDLQQKQSEIELLIAENKLRDQQVAYRNIMVGAAAITIAMLFFVGYLIYRNYQRNKKDNQLLVSRNNEIKTINEELRSYAEALSTQNQTIQKMNDDLEQRVKKRTHELEEINSELDMFLYRASHDIRRPITTLLGLSNLAYTTLQDQNAVRMFDKVTETATHMDRMLHKLQMVYALNRPLGTGTQIQIGQAVRNALEKFAPQMKAIGMDCGLQVSDTIQLTGDESLFSIIFQNLIENAIMFRKTDELERPHLWFEAVLLEEHVQIRIRDNGIGIENTYIEKIFDLHFRGTALSRGNGLGLYLVKKALNLLKGRIEVVSEYGVGSNFLIYFPRT